MKTSTLTLALSTILSVGLSAQSITSSVISSTGGEFSNETSRLSYTVGEISISYFISGNISLSEGFHQSYLDVISDVEELEGISTFRFYPNPTFDRVIMEIDGDLSNLKAALYGAQGQMIKRIELSNQTNVDMAGLASGLYFITFINRQLKTQSISIIKH